MGLKKPCLPFNPACTQWRSCRWDLPGRRVAGRPSPTRDHRRPGLPIPCKISTSPGQSPIPPCSTFTHAYMAGPIFVPNAVYVHTRMGKKDPPIDSHKAANCWVHVPDVSSACRRSRDQRCLAWILPRFFLLQLFFFLSITMHAWRMELDLFWIERSTAASSWACCFACSHLHYLNPAVAHRHRKSLLWVLTKISRNISGTGLNMHAYDQLDRDHNIERWSNKPWSLGGCKLQCLSLLLGDAGQIN